MTLDVAARMRRVRLVVFDVDGTVRAHDDPSCSRAARALDDPSCSRAARALDALDSAGVPWTFSTGRPHGSMVRATEALFSGGRARLATSNYNGSVVHVPGPTPSTEVRTMEPRSVAAVLRLAKEARQGALVFSCGVSGGRPVEAVRLAGHEPDASRIDQYWPGVRELHDPRLGHEEAVTSLVIMTDGIPTMEAVTALRHRLGDGVTVSTSGWTSFEVSDRGVSKGASLTSLARCLGCSTDEVMAVGDGVNDVEMLREAGLGVAVGNAPHAVRDAADLVTSGHAGYGVTEVVRTLLTAIG